jgi:predicted heme/steroid binding protein
LSIDFSWVVFYYFLLSNHRAKKDWNPLNLEPHHKGPDNEIDRLEILMRYGVGSIVLISIALVIIVIITALTVFAQETMNRRFTPEELALYNGTKGRPAYVAVEGKIYDVSESQYWKNGVHQNIHHAGVDLTVELHASPHGKEVLRDVTQVGVLAKSDRLPAFLETFLKRHPVLRRHPHPFLVHFPMVFLFGGGIFMLLNLFRPQWAPFERMAFVMLIMGIIFTPPAIVTGLWSWWVVYSLQPLPQVFYKISLSVTLLFVEIVCLLMRIRRPFERNAKGWIYLALMLYLGAAGMAIGYFGGQLTYGY